MISGMNANTDLVAWASQHTEAMGKAMQDAMEGADARQDETEQISKIQASLERAKAEGNPNYITEAKGELDKLFAEHPDMKSLLGDLYAQVSDADWKFRTKDGTTDYSSAKSYGDAAGSKAWGEAIDTLNASMGSDGAWTTMLGAANESIKKDDDKGMLTIQNLNAQIQQAQQLASNLISSNDQTAMACVGNIRG